MTNYVHLGNVVAARQNFTDDELIKKNIDNLINAKVNTVLPVDDVHITVEEMYKMAAENEVNAKNVETMAKKITIRSI